MKFARELPDESPYTARPVIAGKDARALAEEILAMDESAYRDAFRGSAMKLAKLVALRRNATELLGYLDRGARRRCMQVLSAGTPCGRPISSRHRFLLMTPSELRDILNAALHAETPHVERLAIAAAVISELLRRHGMVATLVGGGAIELYAPGVYTTSDIDLVVEGGTRTDLDAVLVTFGFERRGRHWVLGDLFVEVPGNWMSDPVDVVSVGSLSLRVVRQEVVLADRIIGFKHWRTTAYGAQALALLQVLGTSLDDQLLRARLRAEDAENAYDALCRLADGGATVGEAELEAVLRRLPEQGGIDDRPAPR